LRMCGAGLADTIWRLRRSKAGAVVRAGAFVEPKAIVGRCGLPDEGSVRALCTFAVGGNGR
jgi:hypothetical protein